MEALETPTVGQLVAEQPGRARVFERHQIDYCCGGHRSLDEACRGRDVTPEQLTKEIAEQDCSRSPEDVDWRERPLTELIGHIVETHHGYLRTELPRLSELAERVAKRHGERLPSLVQMRGVFDGLQRELTSHMGKEEQILFPMIEQAEAAGALPQPFDGPIAQMEHEHDDAGAALGELRELSDHYRPPEDACNSHRAYFHGLAQLDDDLRMHIHKENNILFPRAQGKGLFS